jgi:hypothetical protein
MKGEQRSGVGMSRIIKKYFTLDEMMAAWKLPEPDLRYAVENGLLTLSARIVGMRMNVGGYEVTPEGERFAIPYGCRQMDGLVDLCRRDTYALFRDGVVSPRRFCLPGNEYAELMRDEDGVRLKRRDLLVRRDERLEFENSVLDTSDLCQEKLIDFGYFKYDGAYWDFTEMQSRALKFLFDSARTGVPDQRYTDILHAASSASSKLGHLFSSRPYWTQIVKKSFGHRGWYLMEPKLVAALLL